MAMFLNHVYCNAISLYTAWHQRAKYIVHWKHTQLVIVFVAQQLKKSMHEPDLSKLERMMMQEDLSITYCMYYDLKMDNCKFSKST